MNSKVHTPTEAGDFPALPAGKVRMRWHRRSDTARVLAEVLNGNANSRQELVRLLGIRSTTISERVGQLLDQQLLVETASRQPARGRPSLTLVGNPHRVAALVFHVVSQSIHLVCLNLAGQQMGHLSVEVPPEAGNEAIAAQFRELHRTLMGRLPAHTVVAGASFSLPGLIDTDGAVWIFSSRWPRMRRLDLGRVLPQDAGPVFAARNLDAEMQARLDQGAAPGERVLLLHWGYGIGTAFSSQGAPIVGGGGFGEIGHWTVPEATARCRCGRVGCLETVSALWSIGPDLLGSRFSDSAHEQSAAEWLEELDLKADPTAMRAVRALVSALGNLCRVLFPSRIVVSGPFVANPGLWQALRSALRDDGVLLDLPIPDLVRDPMGHRMGLIGAANAVLEAGLDRLGI